QLKRAHVAALEEIERLKQSTGDEHLFDPAQTTDREIAVTMIGRLEGWRGRARKVARLMLELLDEQKRGRQRGLTFYCPAARGVVRHQRPRVPTESNAKPSAP